MEKNLNLHLLLLFLLLINISLYNVNCTSECDGCSQEDCSGSENCDSKCKKYISSDGTQNLCVYCEDFHETSNKYYSFQRVGDSSDITCTSTNTAGNGRKKISETYELVETCPSSSHQYNLGSICYSTPPSNSVKKEDNNEYDLKCQYSYTKEIIDNLEQLNCLAEDSIPSDSNFKYITRIDNNINQYTKQCEGENEKTKEEVISEITYYHCLGTCPSGKNYYYELDNYAINCVNQCDFINNGDFYKGEICYTGTETCSGYIKIDQSKNIFECIEQNPFSSCPDDYLYLYQKFDHNYCLKSCQYTKSIQFFDKTTYSFERKSTEGSTSTIIYECLEDIPNDTSSGIKYYKDNSAFKIITDCTKTISGPYHNDSDNTCYNSCDEYYKDLECVSECNPTPSTGSGEGEGTSTTYYILEETKTCYTKCPSNLKKGFYKDNNKCVECNITEGFHKAKDQKCYETFESIGSDYYHDYGNNFCFDKECKDYSEYKYHKAGEKICYKSCSDIQSLGTTTPIYEKNYVCWNHKVYN